MAYIPNSMSYSVLQFCTLFLHLLVTGIFWGPLFSLHRSLEVFDQREFIKLVKTLANNLALPMRIMMPLCLVLLLLATWFHPARFSIGFYETLAAFLLMVLALIITLAVEVPIVNGIVQWTENSTPADWQAIRQRWVRFHVLRTVAALLSFACFTWAVLFSMF